MPHIEISGCACSGDAPDFQACTGLSTTPMQKLDDRIYQWFLKRTSSDSGKVRTKGIMAKLCADIVNNPIDLRKALKNLQTDERLVSYRTKSAQEKAPSFNGVCKVIFNKTYRM